MSAATAKKALRSQLRQVLSAVPLPEIAEQSQQISKQLQSIITAYKYDTQPKIGCFLSMDHGEVDTKYILEWLFSTSPSSPPQVFLPRCTSTKETGHVKLRENPTDPSKLIDHPHLTFHYVDSLATIKAWKPQGKYQLREPPRESPDPLPPKLDIMIVPGVAFNVINGARMGWGAGYYDDFFKRYILQHNNMNKPPLLIGVALKQQVVPHIQLEAHDQLMDCIVVGDGTIHWINIQKKKQLMLK